MHALFVVGILAAVCAGAVIAVARKRPTPHEPSDDDIRKLYEILARAERYDPANQRAHHRR